MRRRPRRRLKEWKRQHERRQDGADEGDAAGFAAAGVCPFGDIKYVTNNYTNMALRTIEGMDLGIYFDIQTDYGDFDLRYIGTFLDKFCS